MEMDKYMADLKRHGYPIMHDLEEDEIAYIFGSDNRPFLISWFVNKLSASLGISFDCTDSAEMKFANFFHDCGFCASSESIPFVNGSLGMKEQMKIFDRLFVFMEKTYRTGILPQMVHHHSMNEETEAFIKKDRNLFPSLASSQLRSFGESSEKAPVHVKDGHADTLEINDVGSSYNKSCEKFETGRFNQLCLRFGDVPRNSDDTRMGFQNEFVEVLVKCYYLLKELFEYNAVVNRMQMIDGKCLLDTNTVELFQISKKHLISLSDILEHT